MDELMDLLAKDGGASQISDKIKDMLYAKTAEKVDSVKPDVATGVFGDANTGIDGPHEIDVAQVGAADNEE